MKKFFLSTAVLALYHFSFAQADSAAIYLQKGLDEKAKAHHPQALALFEKAYHFDSHNKQAASELAASYLQLRRYAQARQSFIELENMGDHTDSTYRQLMLISYNMRQYDDAIKYASLLKKNNPSEKTAYILAKSFYGKEDLGNAIKYFAFAEKENPTEPDIPYTVARSYTDLQNFKAAIPYFQKALALKTDPRWIYEMALVYYAIPDEANSLKYMLEAGDKGYKKDNEYLQNLAVAYLNAGKPAEGIVILKELLQKRPGDINLLNQIAEAYYYTKNYKEAINHYDQLLQIDKTNAEALYMIGLSFQKSGEREKGMALCDKAIQMNPSLKSLKQEKKMPEF